jgi:peptidoglycan/LPS O-acetylase OafA/YrhL
VELRLYLAILLAGVSGLLARRVAWLATLLALLALFIWRPEWFPMPPYDTVTRDLVLLFALGSLSFVWRDTIPVSLPLAGFVVLLLIVNPAEMARTTFFAPLLAYLIFVAAYHPRVQWRAFNRVGDYSYGVYVYSFPIQQTVLQRIPGLEPLSLFALSMLFTLGVAAVSWHGLESPALRLKSRFMHADRTPR